MALLFAIFLCFNFMHLFIFLGVLLFFLYIFLQLRMEVMRGERGGGW